MFFFRQAMWIYHDIPRNSMYHIKECIFPWGGFDFNPCLLVHFESHAVNFSFSIFLAVQSQVLVLDICYPLVNVYITMENHHFIAGKIHELSTGPWLQIRFL